MRNFSFYSKCLAAIAGFSAVCFAGPALAGDLQVEINGISNPVGRILVAIYSDRESFDAGAKAVASVAIRPSADRIRFTISDLPPGKYAVAAFHDANDNETLDKNLIGIPKEGYGFSNDARGVAGPPGFDAAAIPVADGQVSTVFGLDY